ncbi:MAG TPA: response regulator [Polyangiaceae bacterium]|nr:response regulator [Polyangiaceae bacterium]
MSADDPGRLSLLVVDDDAVDRAAVRRALRASGLEVELVEVFDAPEALEALRRGGHDCALLDFRLPRGDGLAVLRAARAEGLTTPVVVLTGQGDEALAVELMKAGALDYVAKGGLTPERLRQSVVHAVRLRRAELAAAAERRRVARLHAFTATLATTRTVPEVAAAVLREGLAAFEADRGVLAVLAEGAAALDVVGAKGYSDDFLAPWRRVPLSSDVPLAVAVNERELQLFEGRSAFEARHPDSAPGRAEGAEALAALPLIVAGRALGCVGLSYDRPVRFDDDERRDLVAFGRVCAQALERAQLFELAQAERLRAEEANRAKDEFLAVISHELRTPLNAVLGWTRLLRAGGLSAARAAQALEIVERNAGAQAQLIEDLLDVSRITAGKLRLRLRPVDLGEVVEAALDVVRPAAEAKGVRLQAALDGPPGRLIGDPDRLQQIAWNLLSNAVKFTPAGGRVWARVRADGPSVELEVGDTGRGIAPDFLSHAFERFRQADGGPARSHGGLGLGLSIVKSLVELHGGTVEARSEGEGRGAVFVARLPAAPPPDGPPAGPPGRPAAPPGAAAAPGFPGPPRLEGARVLVVDDEPDGRDFVATALAQCGAEVAAAADAAEALARVAAARFDAIVSDIGLPGEDGYALLRRVRALPDEAGGRTPAVALTAFARGEDRARALAAGFDVHLAKPVEPAELVLALARLVGRGRSGRPDV